MVYFANRIIYILFAALMVMSFIIDYSLGKKNRLFQIIALICILATYIFLGAMRGQSVGFDTAAYSNMYLNDPVKYPNFFEYLSARKPEFLFYGVMRLSYVLHFPELIFRLFAYLTISLCLFFVTFKKKYGLLFLEMFLAFGFFTMSFTGIRQTLAVAFCLVGFNELIDPNFKYKKRSTPYIVFYAALILAIMCHKSALLLIGVPLLFKIRIEKSWSFMPLLFLPFIPIFAMGIFRFSFIEFGIEYSVTSGRMSFLFLLTLFLFSAFLLVFVCPKINSFFVRKNIINKVVVLPIDFNYLVWGVYLLLIITVMNFVTQILTRYAMFFYIFDSYVLLSFLDNIYSKRIKAAFAVFLSLIFSIYFIYGLNTGGVVPYVF